MTAISVELTAFSKTMRAGIAIDSVNVLDGGWTRHLCRKALGSNDDP
jgi:hypothetical protein